MFFLSAKSSNLPWGFTYYNLTFSQAFTKIMIGAIPGGVSNKHYILPFNKRKTLFSYTTRTYLSLSLSSPLLLFKVTACKVSRCWVTSSTQRQFTNSWRCKEALQCGHCDLCSVNHRLIQT